MDKGRDHQTEILLVTRPSTPNLGRRLNMDYNEGKLSAKKLFQEMYKLCVSGYPGVIYQ